jgi:hypothetical protein
MMPHCFPKASRGHLRAFSGSFSLLLRDRFMTLEQHFKPRVLFRTNNDTAVPTVRKLFLGWWLTSNDENKPIQAILVQDSVLTGTSRGSDGNIT